MISELLAQLAAATVLAAGQLGAGAATLAEQDPPADQGAPAAALAELSLPQRVGQLFMVGTPAGQADQRTRAQIRTHHVGSVMLTGRSYTGTAAPREVSRSMRSAVSRPATGNVRLFVATDQEGGQVRVLQGPGFSDNPSALVQGGWRPADLRRAAHRWADQLHDVGVNMNLAPVLDTVPSPEVAQDNPPIGSFDRQFGYTTPVVSRHGVAFQRGMEDGGVVPTAKHFPGLGRVSANTDTAAGVTDRVTRRHDPYLRPFRAAIDAGAPVVMMSTAYYEHLDPDRPAAFSPFVIGRMLRGDLGFDGVVISDDLAEAKQVASYPPADRAVLFLRAGGDLVLTVDPGPLPAMRDAVLRRARTNDAFRAKVDAAALRVLRAKHEQGLLPR
ncbi:MAG: glycoside hydrolase family 3 N-terminal domain-containing protein [Nocardioides sp.]